MMRQVQRHVLRAALTGATAGALGTAAMDLVEFRRYRLGGGGERLVAWETARGVAKWDNASAPAQFGKRVTEAITAQELPNHLARTMTNVVHWTTGIGFGAGFGLLNGLCHRQRLAPSLLLGPTVWLTGYIILPLVKVYEPIWHYDRTTLAKDLGTHIVYGSVTAASFAVLTRSLVRS
jgi:hypothetical protein